MKLQTGDIIVAERVADVLSDYGYAHIEDDKAVELAALLCAFLLGQGVQTWPEQAEKYAERVGARLINS